jgi:hypothetical protein
VFEYVGLVIRSRTRIREEYLRPRQIQRALNKALLKSLTKRAIEQSAETSACGKTKNPWLRAFYERLRARGELPMVAMTASMRKLLAAVLSVAMHRCPLSRSYPPLLRLNTQIALAEGDGITTA